MNRPTHEPTDAELLGDLRAVWEVVDPMPADLPDRVLFALDLEELELDFELLRLVSAAQEELSVRNAVTDVNTITFSGPSISVMLRIAEGGQGRRKIDGWVAPGSEMRVTVYSADGAVDVDVDARGRFVASDVPAGLTRLVLTTLGDPGSNPFITPTVEI